MSYQMKLDEMQEVLSNLEHPQADAFEQALCSIGNAMAAAIGATLDIEHGETTQEGRAFAGMCCPFHPRYRNQPLHEAMNYMDAEEEWVEAAKDPELPPMPKGGK